MHAQVHTLGEGFASGMRGRTDFGHEPSAAELAAYEAWHDTPPDEQPRRVASAPSTPGGNALAPRYRCSSKTRVDPDGLVARRGPSGAGAARRPVVRCW